MAKSRIDLRNLEELGELDEIDGDVFLGDPWASDTPGVVKSSTAGNSYDIVLFARIGLHCHNFQKGTNYKFKRWEMYTTQYTSFMHFYITFEATDPASGSVLSFQTVLMDWGSTLSWGVRLTLMSLGTRIKHKQGGRDPLYHTWDEESAAIDGFYKGPMPKWFSDEALTRDVKKFYVVQESELHENHDWLQLLMEVAFFSATDRCVNSCKPLMIEEVVVETLEEHTTDACEKLKANNAIFYISYKLSGGPSKHAIIRKTMDGKPGHMCLEVAYTKEQVQRRTR